MIYTATKSFELSGSHHLELNYPSPCSRVHGHNWHVKVFMRAKKLDGNGMVMDFKSIKQLISDKFDHQDINAVLEKELFKGFNPTAENMAWYIMVTLPPDMGRDCYCYRVEIQESDGNVASLEVDSLEDWILLYDNLNKNWRLKK